MSQNKENPQATHTPVPYEERLAAAVERVRRRHQEEEEDLRQYLREEKDPDNPFRLRTEEDEWADLQEYGDGVARHRFARDKEILRSGLSGLVQWPPKQAADTKKPKA